jgi:hypothetical protein
MLISAGCISSAKTQASVPHTQNVTPEPTSYVIVNESQPLIREVILPEYTMSPSEWMFRNNGRYLGQEYQIIRDNASGLKTLALKIQVYDYRRLKGFNESASDSWGTNVWWPHVAGPDRVFLFIMVRAELVGTNGHYDPRFYGFESTHFSVQYQGQIIPETPERTKCSAVKEMENIGTMNGDTRISDYGVTRIQDVGSGIVTCPENQFMHMGSSNAWDGFIVYDIPEKAEIKDIMVLGNFGDAFGNSFWKLEKPDTLSRPVVYAG